MRKGTLLFLLMALSVMACGNLEDRRVVETPPAGPSPIRAEAVSEHVLELASNAYEGRGAGYPGEQRAAKYIAEQFASIGLEGRVSGSYMQEFEFYPGEPEHPGQTLRSRNVVGFLRGHDPALREEIVVLGAHYDGQGAEGQADAGRIPRPGLPVGDVVWNSADDNASAVAALIEIARTITKGARPRRSAIFVAFGAEEHVLSGSVFYVAHPPYPLSEHVAMVNLEKLDRVPDQELAVASSGTSAAWPEALERANAVTGRQVEPVITEIIADTDHYPFAVSKIPAIVVGTIHEDDTHQPTDSLEKIDHGALAERSNFVLALMKELLGRESRPEFSADIGADPGLLALAASGSERAELGLDEHTGALKVCSMIPD